jgi:hypothetical protein
MAAAALGGASWQLLDAHPLCENRGTAAATPPQPPQPRSARVLSWLPTSAGCQLSQGRKQRSWSRKKKMTGQNLMVKCFDLIWWWGRRGSAMGTGRCGHVGRGASACSTRRTWTRPRRAATRRNASSYPGAAAKARRARIPAAFLDKSVGVWLTPCSPWRGAVEGSSNTAAIPRRCCLGLGALAHRSCAALARVTRRSRLHGPQLSGPTPPNPCISRVLPAAV